MSSVKNTCGALLSTAAAALLASAPLTASAQGETEQLDGQQIGKCWGVNDCRGRSSCKGLTSSCKGQNNCKSEGFIVLRRVSCSELGGDFTEGGSADMLPPE